MLFIAFQARKKFPTLPANEIAFAIDFTTQIPEVEILHLDEAISRVPHFNDTIRSAASDKRCIYLSTHAFSADCPNPRAYCQHVTPARCDELYNLLDALRQPAPATRRREECLEAAKEACQTSANLLNVVRLDFRSFLVDSSRRHWSSWNAKDIVCRSFDTTGIFWESND